MTGSARICRGYRALRYNLRVYHSMYRAATAQKSSPAGIVQRAIHHHARGPAVAMSSEESRRWWLVAPMLVSVAGLGAAVELGQCEQQKKPSGNDEEVHELINWSGTHSVETKRYHQPETLKELKDLVKRAHQAHEKLRPVGSALSPNGLGLEKEGMINLVMMDKILAVDPDKKQVRVQAGARVKQLVDALRPYGLTLQNFASIQEQQIGGFTQVGAHGTGASIPPVDEQVVAMKLITPAAGELDLSLYDDDPSLFHLARTSMGLLGIVAELTLQCVAAHRLVEKTFVMTRAELRAQHESLLRKNKHLRYMWIPHTDSVVVVTCNPFLVDTDKGERVPIEDIQCSLDERLAATRNLLKSHPARQLNDNQIMELGFTSLRDELLAIDPLNVEWVKKVNQAEADFWKKSQGTRVDWSDRVLQFDCGGQQWVSEVAFPIPKESRNHPDLQYVLNLMDLIEKEKIPAHAPIEQRWTAASLSPMSPAGEKPDKELAGAYSWVGIIMYLPNAVADTEVRKRITNAFKWYKTLCEERLWPDARAVEHWAKIEMPESSESKARLQLRTYQKYPVEAFKAICSLLDPHGILRNDLMDTVLGVEESEAVES